MAYLYLREGQIKSLFTNKYLEEDDFTSKRKKHSEHPSLKFIPGNDPHPIGEKKVIFLSQFEHVILSSEKSINKFSHIYNIPKGFLFHSGKEKEIPIIDESERDIETNFFYLAIRRAFIYTFLSFYTQNDVIFNKWFEIYHSINKNPVLLDRLLPEIIKNNELPVIPLTIEFAKNSKIELQYIYLGRILGELFFDDRESNRLDEIHKLWLTKLKPDNKMVLEKTPERFDGNAPIIVGYLLALRLLNDDHTDVFKLNFSDLIEIQNTDVSKTEVIFYTLFWIGLLQEYLDNSFHTSISHNVIHPIELKTYQLLHDIKDLNSFIFNNEQINSLTKQKNQKTTSRSRIYAEYCLMYSGEKPKEKTREDVLTKISNHDLFEKDTLLVFFKEKETLNLAYSILSSLTSLRNILLVNILNNIDVNKVDDIHYDVTLEKVKKTFLNKYINRNIEILAKNKSSQDREIVNNIKAFLNKYSSDQNFIYLVDELLISDKERIKMWMAHASIPTPIFSEDQNYFMIT